MNFGQFLFSCCVMQVVVTTTACAAISDFRPNPFQDPTPTPDLPATIDAAVARAAFSPTVTATAVAPTFTPRLTPTPAAQSVPSPSSPTFGPRPTPTSRSPLSRLTNGDWVERTNPSAAAQIKVLFWIADGITQPEESAVEGLLYLANYPTVLGEVISLSWVADGVNQMELTVIERINGVAYHDVDLAERVANLAWVADGIEQIELDSVDSLGWIASHDAALSESIIKLSWVVDGITELETGAVGNLALIANADVVLAWRVVGMPWLLDGVTEAENAVVDNLFWIADTDVGVARQVAAMTWLADDVTAAESSVLEELWHIGYKDAAAATRLVGMPFLRTLEPPDVVATESLASLALSNAPAFREVMSHSTFTNGITDEWAPIVATLYHVSEEAPALVDILLDPAQVTQEWSTVKVPLSGAVDLVIIRTGPGARRSMDLLEHSVRSAEEFMGLPLPTNYAGLLFGNTVSGYSEGTNYSTHIAVLPEYDVDDGGENAEFAGHLIAHEVAHYYWASGRDWIDEGVSDFMASIAENARVGRPIEATNYPCEYTDNIVELERLSDLGNDDVFGCNYSLGEGFFLDLYFTLGDRLFREGLRRLYRMSLVEDDADDYEGTQVDISHVEDAFPSDAAKAVIARWYYGVAP